MRALLAEEAAGSPEAAGERGSLAALGEGRRRPAEVRAREADAKGAAECADLRTVVTTEWLRSR